MNPTQPPAATPAPLHDIAGPVWFFPYPVWMAVVAGLLLLGLIGLIVWWIRRRRPARPLTVRERAMAVLAELRKQGAQADSYAFGVRVSDALRTYIRDQFGLDAVRRTSMEFLETLRNEPVFSENEKAALAEFLEAVDLLKYARHTAGAQEINALLEIAERVVQTEKVYSLKLHLRYSVQKTSAIIVSNH